MSPGLAPLRCCAGARPLRARRTLPATWSSFELPRVPLIRVPGPAPPPSRLSRRSRPRALGRCSGPNGPSLASSRVDPGGPRMVELHELSVRADDRQYSGRDALHVCWSDGFDLTWRGIARADVYIPDAQRTQSYTRGRRACRGHLDEHVQLQHDSCRLVPRY